MRHFKIETYTCGCKAKMIALVFRFNYRYFIDVTIHLGGKGKVKKWHDEPDTSYIA